MDRRKVLLGSGGALTTLVAGCIGELTEEQLIAKSRHRIELV